MSITPHINLLIVHLQEVALEEGQCFLRYFGVQFYGECWSDHEAETRYAMHGVADKEQNCIEGWCQSLVSSSKDRTYVARLVSVLTDFDVSFSFVNKVSACSGPTLCINLHRGGTWDAGKITLVTEQCRSCSLTSGQELTGLTLEVSVSICM